MLVFYFKVMYQVLVNGNSIKKIQNTQPVKYQNVKVWAARGISYPAAVNAKNLCPLF